MVTAEQYLPAEPLRRIIEADLERVQCNREDTGARIRWPGLSLLASTMTLDQRRLRYLLDGQETVSLSVADLYCRDTGRHLRDVYPDLYEWEDPEDAWQDLCPHCAHPWATVEQEGRRRLQLRCQGCGKRRHVHVSGYVGRGGKPLPAATVERWAAFYEAGVSCETIARVAGCTPSNVQHVLRRHGVRLRGRGWEAVEPANRQVLLDVLAANRANIMVTARLREWRVWRLRRLGWQWAKVAQAIGISWGGVRAAGARWRRRAEVEPPEVATCTGCGETYPVAPPDLVACDPWLAECPRCTEVPQWQQTA